MVGELVGGTLGTALWMYDGANELVGSAEGTPDG